jgi:hypothetical protein
VLWGGHKSNTLHDMRVWFEICIGKVSFDLFSVSVVTITGSSDVFLARMWRKSYFKYPSDIQREAYKEAYCRRLCQMGWCLCIIWIGYCSRSSIRWECKSTASNIL